MSAASQVLDEHGRVSPNSFQIGDDAQAAPAFVPPVPAQSAEPARHAPAKSKASQLSTRQLISQLKARLRVVDREIKARKELERERAQIQRLLIAATTERDNLRRIRETG